MNKQSSYSVKLAALDGFSAPMQRFDKTSAKLVDNIKVQRAELKTLDTQQKQLTGFDKLQSQLSQTSDKLTKAKQHEQALQVEQQQTQQQSSDVAAQYKATNAQVRKLTNQQTKQQKSLDFTATQAA